MSAALEQALEDRVDAAVASGAITKAEGDRAKAMIESGELPLFFAGGHHRPGASASATTGPVSRERPPTSGSPRRSSGPSSIRKDPGADRDRARKTAAGLVQALYEAKKKDLDAAVAAGKLTGRRRTRCSTS